MALRRTHPKKILTKKLVSLLSSLRNTCTTFAKDCRGMGNRRNKLLLLLSTALQSQLWQAANTFFHALLISLAVRVNLRRCVKQNLPPHSLQIYPRGIVETRAFNHPATQLEIHTPTEGPHVSLHGTSFTTPHTMAFRVGEGPSVC